MKQMKQFMREQWLAFSLRRHAWEAEHTQLKQKWGGWYIWSAEKYWYLSDKLQNSAHNNRLWTAVSRQAGGNPKSLALGIAEGTILCKVSVFLWAPPQLWFIIKLFQTQAESDMSSESLTLVERYKETRRAIGWSVSHR